MSDGNEDGKVMRMEKWCGWRSGACAQRRKGRLQIGEGHRDALRLEDVHLLARIALHPRLVAVLVFQIAEVSLPLPFLKLLLPPAKQHHNGNRDDQNEDDDNAGQDVGKNLRGANGGQV